jgi:uncharacterized protein (TIGR02285 family)
MTLRPLALLLALLAPPAIAEDLTVYYPDRPPFLTTGTDGGIGGLVGDQAKRVFAAAGLSVRWMRVPPQRVLPVLKSSQSADCSPGWYWTAERQSSLRFSQPIYVDRPFVALVRADFAGPSAISAKDLLNRPDLRLTLRLNMAHGVYIDSLIARMPAHQVRSLAVDNVSIVKMIKAGHTDLTFLTGEEVDGIIADAGLKPGDFKQLRLNDQPRPEPRYIVCSRTVTPATMLRIDRAIKELGLP